MNAKSILQSLSAGVAVLDDGCIEYANEVFGRLLGTADVAITGLNLAEVVSENSRQLLTDVAFPMVMRNGWWRGILHDTSKKVHGDLMFEMKELGRSVLVTVWPVLSSEQGSSGIRRANAELTMANRIKDTFLANMSHDLRSPLATIMGVCEALIEGIYGDLNPEQARAMNDVNETSGQLLSLINDLLDLSRVRFGAFDLQRETVELRSLIRSITEIPTSEMRSNNIQIDVDLPSQDVHVNADPRRLRQVLMNIIHNAAKFSHPGGRIAVSLNADSESNSVAISVGDHGIGIPADKLSTIFEPFVQLDPLSKRWNSGSGLGLSIAQRIVDLHGGVISVSSELQKGSTFTVVIPMGTLVPSKNSEPSDRSRKALIDTKSTAHSVQRVQERLLFVVDDNKMQCELLAEFAHRAGFRACTFTTGPDCLRGLDETWPDIAIVDVYMPEMNGLDLIQRIREREAEQSLPIYIIALTALSMPGDRELCLASGANAFISKPVVYRELMQFLSRHSLRS